MPDATPVMLTNISERLIAAQEEAKNLQTALENLENAPGRGDVGRIDELRAAGLSRGDPTGSRLDEVRADSSEGRAESTAAFSQRDDEAEKAAIEAYGDVLEKAAIDRMGLMARRLEQAGEDIERAARDRMGGMDDYRMAQVGLDQEASARDRMGGMDRFKEAQEELRIAREFREELLGFTGDDYDFGNLVGSIKEAGRAGEISKGQLEALLELVEKLSGKTVDIKVKATGEGPVPLLGSAPDGLGDGSGAKPTAEVDLDAAVGPGEHLVDPDSALDQIFDLNGDKLIDAGENFASQVGQAGADFATGLRAALADGKITGDEAAGLGSQAGGALGSAAGYLLGGPAGSAIGGFLGSIAGELIGGLFGGDDDEEDRRNADASRRTNAAALELNFYFNQVNNFPNNINDAQTQASLRKQSRSLVQDALKAYDPKQFRGETT